MLIVHTQTKPPCWDRLVEVFKVNWVSGVTVTYGGEIYTFDSELKDDVLVHEAVHVQQQKGIDPDEYVERYIADIEFRKKVEKEAFIVHMAFIRATETNEGKKWMRLYTCLKSYAATCGVSLEEADHALSRFEHNEILKS